MAASCLGTLTWVVVIGGVVVSFIIGLGSATIIAKVSFLLGGFVMTAITGLMLIIISKLIYLLIKIEEDLSKIADNTEQK